jgi:hypothetical protein
MKTALKIMLPILKCHVNNVHMDFINHFNPNRKLKHILCMESSIGTAFDIIPRLNLHLCSNFFLYRQNYIDAIKLLTVSNLIAFLGNYVIRRQQFVTMSSEDNNL